MQLAGPTFWRVVQGNVGFLLLAVALAVVICLVLSSLKK
jgi:hypothetical protein